MIVEIGFFAACRWEATNLDIDTFRYWTVLVAQLLLLLSEILDFLTHLADAFVTFLAEVRCIVWRCSPLLGLINGSWSNSTIRSLLLVLTLATLAQLRLDLVGFRTTHLTN